MFAHRFHIPVHTDGTPVTYFCGNSLGLQPKALRPAVEAVLKDWELLGVHGHFTGSGPWVDFHKSLTAPMAAVVGALPHETVVMNTLTANLHLLMCSFYRPRGGRTLILTEAGSFPSDIYALRSQAMLHGFDPDTTVIEVAPRSGEHTLRTEDIIDKIEELGPRLAVLMMAGVNYYTGQLLEIDKITSACHAAGAIAGFDMAHAAGNVPLQLHDDKVDFAVWCSYKYLNAGPGGPGGVFIHEKHSLNPGTFRLAGWWGHDPATRFEMGDRFMPAPGAEGWQLSNAQVLAFTGLKAALDEVEHAGINLLFETGKKMQKQMMTGLRSLNIPQRELEILTPDVYRGNQTSLLLHAGADEYFDILTQNGIVADRRGSRVVRVAPVPLYNSAREIDRFLEITETYFKRRR